ncbi:restriction endonuclease subunit S [Psychrosphaera haliotis]|nr:restriction endonuclease subunit S [Psychrosphaera haliotis]
MSIWDEKLLGDFCAEITVGFVGTQSKFFVNQGIPLIRGQNVKEYELDLSEPKFIPAEIHEGWKKSKLVGGDIVIVRVGYPGTAAVIPENFGDCNCASVVIVRTKKQELNPYFATYFINSPKGKAQISGMLVGSAQQVFNATAAKTLKLPVPPIDVQNKVIDVLDKYTLLIKNNNRRIAILEEMAQSLYREWFVNFRYTVHKDNLDADGNQKLVDSPLGKIPGGWEVHRLKDTSSMKYGKISKKALRCEEGIPIYSGYRVTGYYPEANLNESKVIIVARGVGGTGDVKMSPDQCWLTNLSIYLVENENLLRKTYLYFQLKSGNLRSLDSGTSISQITISDLGTHQILVPPIELQKGFEEHCNTIWSQIKVLNRKNENLKQQRDMLLPKLISGTIRL